MFADLKLAFRQLAKAPGVTLVAVLSLALGIGANTTVLCWMRGIVQRPLPGVADQPRMAVLVSNEGGGNISLLDARDFDALHGVFAGVAASQVTPASLTIDGSASWIYGQVATANFFDLLGIKPLLGRTFLPEEDRKPGGDFVLVPGENLWRRRFGADPAIIGRVIDLNRHAFTVIGVVPAEFRGTMTGLACEFWAPVSMVAEVASWPAASMLTSRNSRPFHNVARLQPGVSVAQAQAAVATFDGHLATAYPKSNRTVRHRVLRYADCPYGAQALLGPALQLLLAVSLGVLLIVAANIGNLLLARAATRQKEIAIRLAAGASRTRLLRQLITESLLLALLGGTGGVLLASWTVESLSRFVPAMREPLALSIGLNLPTLGFTLGLTLLTGLVFGLAPALQTSHPRLYEILKEGGRSSSGGASQHRMRSALVIAEVALALVLLVSAGLCLKGLRRAQEVDIGFKPDRVLIAGLQIGMNGYNEQTGRVFYRQLQQRLAQLPGVEEAALSSWFPLGLAGCKGHGVEVEGYVRPSGENPTYEYSTISPRYFALMGIPLLSGRDFTDADEEGALNVAIVNEHFAQKFWPGQDPLGRKFRAGGRTRTIVGVAKAGKYRQLNEPPHEFFYLPYRQYVPDLDLSICVRTRDDPLASAGLVRQTVRELDPGVDVWGTMPLSGHIGGALFAQRIAAKLLTCLGAVALLLAGMGVYAVMAYAVSQRTQEFGVRMALGASPANVLWQVVHRGLLLAVAGVAAGLVLAFSVTHLLSGFLYGVSPFDPPTFLGVPALLVIIAVLACYLPARRATRVNPMEALRAE
jgi:predicted permease